MNRLGAVLVAVVAGAALAACGSSGPSGNGIANESASQIASTVAKNLQAATSVTMSGSETRNGTTMSLSGSFYTNGDVDATIDSNGLSEQLIKIGSNDYIKASSAYWAKQGLPSADLSKVDNVWILLPDSLVHLGNEFSLSKLASSATNHVGNATNIGTSTVDGQQAVGVRSSKGLTIYVATVGTAYPIKLEGTLTSGATGTFTFSNWNTAPAPTAPAGAKTIQQLGLGGGGASSGSSGA